MAGIEYTFYGVAVLLSIISLFYHIINKFDKVLPTINVDKAGQDNAEIDNDSVHKLESKESKRSRVEKDNPILEQL